ncbi:MAG: ABC transporter substrate-binding protein [Victivallaceae bacterium]|nr:ABC transporter substrate-binding protein [Victivallaceae bacterium]
MNRRIFWALLAPALLLAIPFVLRSPEETTGRAVKRTPVKENMAEKLVIVSPHTTPIKEEFARAFQAYYREKYAVEIEVEFLNVGGTSDIVRFIADRYCAQFRKQYEKEFPDANWEHVQEAFADPSTLRRADASPQRKAARKLFLDSDTSIGIDLMFGGGTYDADRQAQRGFAVDAKVKELLPEAFRRESIPESFGGEILYDRNGGFYGTCLSSFGLCFNPDRRKALGNPPVARWRDLGSTALFDAVAVADPTKSGSINKCFEVMIQQEMLEAFRRDGRPDAGWTQGLNLLKRIFANARMLGDSAGKVTQVVAAGECAAGMSIDFYGRSESEWSAFRNDGYRSIVYHPPVAGAAVSADPVQMLRGAPNPRAAREFIAFVLSLEGQKLWCFRPGTPGGPKKYELLRTPIRRELYHEKYARYRSNPEANPYRDGADFVYHGEWTGRYFSLIRVFIKCAMLDVHADLSAAWKAILTAGGPSAVPEAMKEFNALPFDYHGAAAAAGELRGEKGAMQVVRLRRFWSDEARKHYRKAKELAEAGR